jgi:hypothetical protein
MAKVNRGSDSELPIIVINEAVPKTSQTCETGEWPGKLTYRCGASGK